jgi:hypothetical protein
MELAYHKIKSDDEKKPNYEAVLECDGLDDTHLGKLQHSTVKTDVGEFPCWQYIGPLGGCEKKTLKELKRGIESELRGLIKRALDGSDVMKAVSEAAA